MGLGFSGGIGFLFENEFPPSRLLLAEKKRNQYPGGVTSAITVKIRRLDYISYKGRRTERALSWVYLNEFLFQARLLAFIFGLYRVAHVFLLFAEFPVRLNVNHPNEIFTEIRWVRRTLPTPPRAKLFFFAAAAFWTLFLSVAAAKQLVFRGNLALNGHSKLTTHSRLLVSEFLGFCEAAFLHCFKFLQYVRVRSHIQ